MLRVDDLRIGTTFADVARVAITANNPASPTAGGGSTDNVVGRFQARTLGGPVTLTAVTLTANGSGNDASTHVSGVKLWIDRNGNGALDVGADAPVAAGPATFSGDNGTLRLAPVGAAATLAGSTTTALFVTYDFSASVVNGDTFGFTIATATAGLAGSAPAIDGLPTASAQLTISGATTLGFSPANPQPQSRTVTAGSGDNLIAAITLAASGAPVTLTSLTLQSSGTGNDTSAEVTSVRLFRENNNTPGFDAGDDLLGSGTYAADNGQLTIALSPTTTIIPSSPVDLYLAYSFAGAAVAGRTFALSVTAAATAQGATIQNLPFSSALLTIDVPATPTLVLGGPNASSRTVAAGSASQVVLDVTLSTIGASAITVTSLDFAASGTGDDRAVAITQAELFLDQGTAGVVDGADVSLGTRTYAANNGTITFTLGGANGTVLSAAPKRLLLAYTFATPVTANGTFSATLLNVVVSGGALVSPATRPGATLTVPAAAIAIARTVVASATVTAGIVDRLVLDVTVTATDNQATLTGLRIDALGGGDDATEVTAVRLFADSNANGTFDGSGTDAALNGAGQTFSANNGFVVLTPTGAGPSLVPGTPVRLFVTYALSAAATGAGSFTPRLTSATAQNGAIGALSLDGATLTVQGGTLAFTATSIPGRQVDPGAQEELTASLLATASGSAVVLVGFDARASGTVIDPTEVSSTSLYRDANANGTFEPALDTLLDRRSFASNDGTVTFSTSALTATPLTLTAGGSARLFVATSFRAAAVPTRDFRVTLENALATGGTVTPPLSITTSFLQIRPGTVLATPATIANFSAAPGALDILVADFTLTTTSSPQSVTSLSVLASGTGNDATRVTAVKLYVDNFGGLSGATLLETRTFPSDNGRIVFNFGGTPRTINPGAGQRIFLVYDLAATAAISETFQATVESVAVQNGVANGVPFDSARVTVLPAGLGSSTGGGSGGGGGGGCAASPAGAGDPAAALPWAALLLALLAIRVRRT